jgi:hypothetical protein
MRYRSPFRILGISYRLFGHGKQGDPHGARDNTYSRVEKGEGNL